MADKKKWIQKAINPEHKGVFGAKAAKAGKSTGAYAREHEHDSGTIGKQARLAETLMSMQHSHNKQITPHSKIQNSFYGKKGDK